LRGGRRSHGDVIRKVDRRIGANGFGSLGFALAAQSFPPCDAEIGEKLCNARRALLATKSEPACKRVPGARIQARNGRWLQAGGQRLERRVRIERVPAGKELVSDAGKPKDVVPLIRG
jgi:hypothetical protein